MRISQEQRDRIEDAEQAAYEEAFNRIEQQLVHENLMNGANWDYKPSGAMVHMLVEREMKARKK